MVPSEPVTPLPEIAIPAKVTFADELNIKAQQFDGFQIGSKDMDENGRNILLLAMRSSEGRES